MTPNGVRGVLYDLERTGVVDILGSGRSRLFRVAPGHPLVEALAALFAAERGWYDQLLGAITTATDHSQVCAVWLFGSVARHEDTADSDIDIAVVVDSDAEHVDTVSDIIRDRLAEQERQMKFVGSIVAMSPADVQRLAADGAPLWSDLVRDARVLRGLSPKHLLEALRSGSWAVTRTGNARPADIGQALGRLRKAAAFHEVARIAFDHIDRVPDPDAVSSNAALAAIAYADAVTAVYGGRINQRDHAGAVSLLRDVLGHALPRRRRASPGQTFGAQGRSPVQCTDWPR